MKEILPWYSIWLTVLIRPNSQTFVQLVNQPNVTKERAYLWVYLGNIGFAATFFAFIGPPEDGIYCGESIGLAIFLLFGFILVTVFIQAIAAILGGSGNRLQLTYAFATYLAPLGVIAGILNFVPLVRYSTIFLIIYGLMLNVIATKAVHRFGWIPAIICNVVVFLITLFSITSFYQSLLREGFI